MKFKRYGILLCGFICGVKLMSYSQQLRAETGVLERPDYDPLGLRGRIELVNLAQHAGGPKSAIGEIMRNGQHVLVTNGHGFIGKNCLVRFDLEHRIRPHANTDVLRGEDEAMFFADERSNDDNLYTLKANLYPLKANFISTEVPWGFEERVKRGLSPEDYILYGRLKVDHIPSFQDVNRSYDPGKMGLFVYIRGESENQEIYLVSSGGVISVATYVGISELLLEPWKRSRVILAKSKKRIRELREEIIDESLIPIRMQPLS